MVGALLAALIAAAPADGAIPKTQDRSIREDYRPAILRLEAQRQALAERYRREPRQRGRILDQAAAEVMAALTSTILPAWQGTPWAFHGTSAIPGRGEIACGMFVGTVLAHAGFNLDRIALGRLASEHIAIRLTSQSAVRRYSDWSVDRIEAELRAWGPGLYLVGLDLHAGLIVVEPDLTLRFVHSSVIPPAAVVSEPPASASPFADSRYRVFAKLLDRRMMRRWLEGDRFPMAPPR